MILVSSCLAGICCKYNGGSNLVPEIADLVQAGQAMPVCPEVLGGLPVPRKCCEIIAGRVINTDGEDVSEQYHRGALAALKICRQNHCQLAVLKANSPSCGCCGIYDGTFSHRVIPGRGIFAQMLAEAGIPCLDETQFKEENRDELL